MTTPDERPRLHLRPRRVIVFALFIAALLILATGADFALRAITTPWDVSIGGRSTLTGAWSGDVVLPDDETAQIVISLSRSPDEDGPNIEGSATICLGSQGATYDVTGNADRSGDIDDLRLRLDVGEPAWQAIDTSTTWNGDELRIAGAWQAAGPRPSDGDAPHRFNATLSRTTLAAAPCDA